MIEFIFTQLTWSFVLFPLFRLWFVLFRYQFVVCFNGFVVILANVCQKHQHKSTTFSTTRDGSHRPSLFCWVFVFICLRSLRAVESNCSKRTLGHSLGCSHALVDHPKAIVWVWAKMIINTTNDNNNEERWLKSVVELQNNYNNEDNLPWIMTILMTISNRNYAAIRWLFAIFCRKLVKVL